MTGTGIKDSELRKEVIIVGESRLGLEKEEILRSQEKLLIGQLSTMEVI